MGTERKEGTIYNVVKDPCKGQSVFEPRQAMQFMYWGEVFYHIKPPNGDAEQTQRTGFNLQTPEKVHS